MNFFSTLLQRYSTAAAAKPTNRLRTGIEKEKKINLVGSSGRLRYATLHWNDFSVEISAFPNIHRLTVT